MKKILLVGAIMLSGVSAYLQSMDPRMRIVLEHFRRRQEALRERKKSIESILILAGGANLVNYFRTSALKELAQIISAKKSMTGKVPAGLEKILSMPHYSTERLRLIRLLEESPQAEVINRIIARYLGEYIEIIKDMYMEFPDQPAKWELVVPPVAVRVK